MVKKRDKRFALRGQKRVQFGPCLVLPSTLKLIQQFGRESRSQGKAIDKAMQALAVAESFGKDSLKLDTQ